MQTTGFFLDPIQPSHVSLSFHFPQNTSLCHTPVLPHLFHRLIFLYYFTEKFLEESILPISTSSPSYFS